MRDRPALPREPNSNRNQALFWLCVLAAYAIALLFTDGLGQSLYKDEKHNWETTQTFVGFQLPPTIDELRSYPELITPLSFTVWSYLERLTRLDVFAGRLLNVVLSLAIVALIALRRRPDDRALLAAIGLFFYPYLLPLSVHLYTDVPAAFLGLAGLALYAHRKPFSSAIFLALAIATRQYLLALPTALAAWALVEQLRGRHRDPVLWIAPACASASIFFWFWIFGGLGPPSGIDKWIPLYPAPMIDFLRLIPEYGLYFLTLVGVYFAIPEFFLFRRWRDWEPPSPKRVIATVLILGLAYAIFPPTTYTNPMGALDRVVRTFVASDGLRMFIFYALALCACLRFRRLDLAFWILAVTFIMDMKSQLAWEKYALPAIVALWYLKSIRAIDEGPFPLAKTGPNPTRGSGHARISETRG